MTVKRETSDESFITLDIALTGARIGTSGHPKSVVGTVPYPWTMPFVKVFLSRGTQYEEKEKDDETRPAIQSDQGH